MCIRAVGAVGDSGRAQRCCLAEVCEDDSGAGERQERSAGTFDGRAGEKGRFGGRRTQSKAV